MEKDDVEHAYGRAVRLDLTDTSRASEHEADANRLSGDRRASETTALHTGILRLALAVEESRSYWEHVDLSVNPADRAIVAFEQRWFGAKSLERVRGLLGRFVARYDMFPGALAALRRWRSIDLPSRQVICHWHMQLSDPLYRRFTGDYLIQRRAHLEPKVDRDAVVRWLRVEYPARWSESTLVHFATKLLSAATEAGLVSNRKGARALTFPRVSETARAYLMYLLRQTRFQGSLTENPYLASVGLGDGLFDARMRSLPGLTFHRQMHLTDFEWSSPDLASWAEAVS